MLADLLYRIYAYQIFKSVAFRGGMAYLTVYLIINFVMPWMIRRFRRLGINSDFKPVENSAGPYRGATPIMGGLLLIPAIIVAVVLWAWLNPFTLALIWITFAFAAIGAWDDGAKVLHKRRVLTGKEEKKSYADKADGIPGSIRLGLEFLATLLALVGLHWFGGGLDLHLHIPFFPLKTAFPLLTVEVFLVFAALVIVGGANAVNLTDGLDSLASVPIVTCATFAMAAAYIAGDAAWSERLLLPFLKPEIKEVVVFAIALISACFAFLKFNSPPASIYMGDVGSLGLGAAVCTMFVLVKAELFLPIAGGAFVLAAISTILQRLWFKLALWRKGRDWALKNRLFYRAPYHHHQQMLITYKEQGHEVHSLWHNLMNKLGFHIIPDEDKFLSTEQVNNKVIWSSHLRSVLLLVIALMVYFKVR